MISINFLTAASPRPVLPSSWFFYPSANPVRIRPCRYVARAARKGEKKLKMAVVLAWLNARVFDPVLQLQVIQRGAEPKQLAFSAELGLTIGIFPICGTTVIIGGIALAMLGARCNAVTLMVMNLAATPLELRWKWEEVYADHLRDTGQLVQDRTKASSSMYSYRIEVGRGSKKMKNQLVSSTEMSSKLLEIVWLLKAVVFGLGMTVCLMVVLVVKQ